MSKTFLGTISPPTPKHGCDVSMSCVPTVVRSASLPGVSKLTLQAKLASIPEDGAVKIWLMPLTATNQQPFWTQHHPCDHSLVIRWHFAAVSTALPVHGCCIDCLHVELIHTDDVVKSGKVCRTQGPGSGCQQNAPLAGC